MRGLPGVGVGARSDNRHPHSIQEKAGRTREKKKRIVLVFNLSFIPIDLDLRPR